MFNVLCKGYTKTCDWWSVGVILYEMLVGVAPFRAETAYETQVKVINWKETLRIPDDCKMSKYASNLIFKLCTHAETRLTADGIKAHCFFKSFDFGPNLRRSKAPYIPTIRHATDTSNFEPIDSATLAEWQAKRQRNRLLLQQARCPNHSPVQTLPNEDPKSIDSNSFGGANPVLYEFTYRRFFDDYKSENAQK